MSTLSKIESYKDLLIWQKGMELVKLTYLITQSFPDEEKFGLTSQLRRSAISIPSNIAEGYGRGTKAQYINYLRIARGSLSELETQFIICKELEFLAEISEAIALIEEESKMINSLVKKLEKS